MPGGIPRVYGPEVKQQNIMKKTPALLLFSIGLALAIAGPASAQVDNLYPRSGTASPTFNDRLETSALAGLGGFPNNSGVNAVPGPANQAPR